jgi:carboxymethylenebutenolidase
MGLKENHVTVTTKHGKCPAFTVCPDEGGPFPAIIFYMDAPGFREELCNMSRRIAKQGYYVLLPDMYYRLGTCRFDLPRRDDPMSTVIRAAMHHLSLERVNDDTACWIQYLDAQPEVADGDMGCVGHCMSGQYITNAAAFFPERIKAAVGFYGVGIVTDKDDSPHLFVDRIKAEMFYSFGENDAVVPDAVIPVLKKALQKAKVKHHVEQPKGSLHGYMFAERAAYNAAVADASWKRMIALYDRNLKKQPAKGGRKKK